MHHKFFGEVLPYLEVKKQETAEDITESIEMPDVIGMTVTEAKSTLKELGLEVNIDNEVETEEANEEKVITEQLPKKGIQVNVGTTVTLYTE